MLTRTLKSACCVQLTSVAFEHFRVAYMGNILVCTAHKLQYKTPHFPKHKFHTNTRNVEIKINVYQYNFIRTGFIVDRTKVKR